MPILRWLRCEVHEGVFLDERTVRIALPRGGVLEAFVPASDVREAARPNRDSAGQVNVTLVQVSDGYWVLLPGENPHLVPVREMDLVA